MRKLRQIIVWTAVLIALFFLLEKFNVIPALHNPFSSKPIVIDQTPVVIKEIKSIGQLITYTSFDEVVADSLIITRGAAFVNSLNRLFPVPLLPPADKQLVLIARGKVLTGVDLTTLRSEDVVFKNDTVRLALPKAKILEAIINPSGFETFIEKGNWTQNEVTLVKIKARRKMIERALQQNIIEKADVKAKADMKNFLQNMGYRHVLVN